VLPRPRRRYPARVGGRRHSPRSGYGHGTLDREFTTEEDWTTSTVAASPAYVKSRCRRTRCMGISKPRRSVKTELTVINPVATFARS